MEAQAVFIKSFQKQGVAVACFINLLVRSTAKLPFCFGKTFFPLPIIITITITDTS